MSEQDYIGVLVMSKRLKTVYLKPFGYATQDNSLGIPDFLACMFREGCVRVAVDLKDCHGMDSTFLGVIADAATNLPRQGGKTVVILNARGREKKEMATVGLLPLVSVIDHPLDVPDGIEFMKADFFTFAGTERERCERIKYLHEQLTQLNERNKKQFGSFVAMLQKELQEASQGTEK